MSIGRMGVRFSPGVVGQSGVGYSTESKAFFSRLGTSPTGSRKRLYDDLIRALVSAGVWSKLDLLHIYAASDGPTALTNLVSSSYGGTAVNSPTFTANSGFAGNDTTSYINTGFIPSAATLLLQNDTHIGVWDMTSRAAALVYQMGCSDASNYLTISNYWNTNRFDAYVNGGTNVFKTGISSSSGHFIANRTSSTAVELFNNGASLGSASNTSSGRPTTALYVGGYNNNGTFAGGTTDQIGAVTAGASLSSGQQSALYSALHAYLQSVAGIA